MNPFKKKSEGINSVPPLNKRHLIYYCRNNFGDQISPVVGRAVISPTLAVQNVATTPRTNDCSQGILSLGSILHFAKKHDIIWGTGVIPHRFSKKALRYWGRLRRSIAPTWDIRVVRGPLTRDFIQKRLGVQCPEMYGDPAVILPFILDKKRHNPTRAYGVIPHYRDLPLINDPNICSPLQPWDQVVDFILSCELVLASSLHGIIVAEAFGVPARWINSDQLPSSVSEGKFKYSDYYLSTSRDPDCFAGSIESALNLGGMPLPNFEEHVKNLRLSVEK